MTFLYRVKIIQYNKNQVGKRKCSPDFSSKEKYNVADTYNQKTDRQDTAGSVYQREIFKRHSRYILVFFCIDGSIF